MCLCSVYPSTVLQHFETGQQNNGSISTQVLQSGSSAFPVASKKARYSILDYQLAIVDFEILTTIVAPGATEAAGG